MKIISQNPVFRLLLGMCPTLAVTTSVSNALGMGFATFFVLVFSNLIVSLLRNTIPAKIRIPIFIVIIVTFVTIVDMIMGAYFAELHRSLGVFIKLITVNCIILGRAEAFAVKNDWLNAIWDGVVNGLGFLLALLMLSSIREVVGSGTWLNIPILPSGYNPAMIFILTPGAFLVLAMIIAALNMKKAQ